MRFLLKTIGFLVVTGVVVGGAILGWGHLQIRRVDPKLPTVDAVLEADGATELPVRLAWINTASQRMSRAGVLDPDLDPNPDAEYTMSHPSFVVEWQDGRIFLIDMGMNAAAAIDFGAMSEMLLGAGEMQPHVTASSQLEGARTRVAGIGFTHMHVDHTGGVLDLCRDLGAVGMARERIPIFQHAYQMNRVNHTTRSAKVQLAEASCTERRNIGSEGGMLPVPGFPGLFAIAAGGHTPGSTMYVVHLRTIPGESEGRYDDVQTWVITGDVVNHFQGVENGIRKPPLYSLFVVPENDERLGKVRAFLKQLASEPGVRLLVNHDRNQIEATNLPAY